MEIENKKYDAFISYRHSELDKFVAENIHKQLEKFKIPKQIRKEKGLEKKSICIFRDQDELPLSSNLADPITEALKNSEFLIVICSPRLKESQWCKREIETFISLHGRNHIFTILVEGEPADSFPEQLLYEEVEEFDEAGNIVIKNKSIEPLAADVRGRNFREVKKKIKHEKLRVLAPMFGLGYDDLRQRHKERVMKQAMAISSGIIAALLGFSAISTYMALQIQEQANQISEQNGKILEQNGEISLKAAEITRQSNEIKKQYDEAQKSYSKSLADASNRILNQGDRMAAVYAARSGMPSNLETPEKPYTSECEYALSDAMYLYLTGSEFVPYLVYPTDGDIQSMEVSDDGTYIVISDSTSQIYVWETKTDKLLLQVQGKNGLSTNMIRFFGSDKIIYESPDGICIQNFLTKDVSCLDPTIETVIPYPDGIHYLALSFHSVGCYNNEDSSLCFEIHDQSLWPISSNNIFIAEDGSRIMLMNLIGKEQLFVILDGQTGDMLYKQPFHCELASSHYENGRILIAAYDKLGITNSKTNLTCIDTKECNILWETTDDNSWLRGMDYIQHGKKEYYYVFSGNQMETYDANTGSLICYNEYSQNITNSSLLKQDENELIMCDDGTMLTYTIETGETQDISHKIDYIDYRIDDFIWIPGAIYIKPKDSRSVLKYKMISSDMTKIAELSQEDIYCVLNDDMSLQLNAYGDGSDKYIGLKDTKTGEWKAKVKNESDKDYIRYFFIGDGSKEFAVITDECSVYSVDDGKKLRTIETEDDTYNFEGWSSDGKLLYAQKLSDPYENVAFSMETGEIVIEMPEKERGYNITTVYSNDQSVFACYDDKKDELRLYHPQEEQPYVTKQVSLVDTRGILFTDDGNYLCVVESNGNPDFYDTKSMELVKTLYDTNLAFLESIQYIEPIHHYVMKVADGAYLLNDDFDIIAAIPNYEGLDVATNSIYIKEYSELSTIPYYSYDALIKEADKLLDGYIISDELKRKYNVE